jgi:hypothetical protein
MTSTQVLVCKEAPALVVDPVVVTALDAATTEVDGDLLQLSLSMLSNRRAAQGLRNGNSSNAPLAPSRSHPGSHTPTPQNPLQAAMGRQEQRAFTEASGILLRDAHALSDYAGHMELAMLRAHVAFVSARKPKRD